MGLLTQIVNDVVDAVDDATGQDDSAAGNAAEQQAANVEDTVDDAADAASGAASDAADLLTVVFGDSRDGATSFGRTIVTHIGEGVGAWLAGATSAAGIPAPDHRDAAAVIGLVLDVVGVSERRIDDKVTRMIGDRAAGAIKDGAVRAGRAVQGGPTGAWKDVKDALGGMEDHASSGLRRWGTKFGATLGSSPPSQAIGHAIDQAPDSPGALWTAIQGVLRDRKTGGTGGLVSLAHRAEEEHRKMLAALRLAVRSLEYKPPTASPSGFMPTLARRYSWTAGGAELRRLSATLLAYSRRVDFRPKAETAAYLADAVTAAARAAVLHAELLTWLDRLRRVAHRTRRIAASRPWPRR